MNQPYPNLHQPRGVDEQTVRIPQYRPAASQVPPAAPAPAAPKKKRRWPWVVGGLVVLGIIGSAIGGNNEPAPAPVPAADGSAIPAVDAPAPMPAVAPVPVEVPPAPVEPEMSVSQENALDKAENYLDYTAFSRSGLIEQLEFEGFSTADATFAVDTVTVDWMVQAEKKAQSYLDYSSFSRSGLIDQLEFEGFTPDEAEHGANSVGL